MRLRLSLPIRSCCSFNRHSPQSRAYPISFTPTPVLNQTASTIFLLSQTSFSAPNQPATRKTTPPSHSRTNTTRLIAELHAALLSSPPIVEAGRLQDSSMELLEYSQRGRKALKANQHGILAVQQQFCASDSSDKVPTQRLLSRECLAELGCWFETEILPASRTRLR